MTEVPCPTNRKHGIFATTWTLFAHLLQVHELEPARAAAMAASALEKELDRLSIELTGRTTDPYWGVHA
ncbi:MAG TPA: hypothetical protein VFF67_03295 [Thermoplasmata archaeon]|nr:hypothetical protein [Thermoplasmata archaeon]